MIRHILLAAVLVVVATSATAKEGCGAGYHFNDKKGMCVPNKQGSAAEPYGGAAVTGGAVVSTPGVAVGVGATTTTGTMAGKACPAGYHLDAGGHCQPN